MANFQRDLAFTEAARELLDRDFYPRYGTAIPLGRSFGSMWLQRNAHIDAVLQLFDGRSVTVEEKIVRKHYVKFAIETEGNLEKSTAEGEPNGWIYTSTADWLLYAFTTSDGLEVHRIDLPALRKWFLKVQFSFPVTDTHNYGYVSRCRLVPVALVKSEVPSEQVDLYWCSYG